MIHYHGTPITPRPELLKLAGRSFCVRYGADQDLEAAHEIGEGVMLDNGAYSQHTSGKPTDWPAFVEWVRPWLDYRTTWAVMPDVIGGDEADNERLSAWLWKHDPEVWRRCAPVWHMHESFDRLKYLCSSHDRVCIGSSGDYWKVGGELWRRRMDEALNDLCGNGPAPTWLHMLRGMQFAGSEYPFASADSTDIGRNHARPQNTVLSLAERWDGQQCAPRWRIRLHTQELTNHQEVAPA